MRSARSRAAWENLEFACGIPILIKGGFSKQASTGVDVYQVRQPLGVVAGITPFNFPAMVPMWMFGNAIACGNTFILKPSEKDPSAALLMAELLAEAGVPAGVFTVVQGDRVAVDRLLEHPASPRSASSAARRSRGTSTRPPRGTGKRVQALGRGEEPHAGSCRTRNIDMAADAAVSAGNNGSAGERCMAIATIVAVRRRRGPAHPRRSAPGLPRVTVGPGTDPASQMGPLVTRQHMEKVASYLESAPGAGAPPSSRTGASIRSIAPASASSWVPA